jgi:hypothetical protein
MSVKMRWLLLKIAYSRWRLGHKTMAREHLRMAFGRKP